MRVIVSDTSCVIDLRKGQLLEAILDLPYTIAMPRPLFDDELLSLKDEEKERLLKGGLEVLDVDGAGVKAARAYRKSFKRLRLYDCFALVVVEKLKSSILLTGDRNLKKVAIDSGVEAHGVLWATDQLYEHKCCSAQTLKNALRSFLGDPLVFVPRENSGKTERKTGSGLELMHLKISPQTSVRSISRSPKEKAGKSRET